MYPVIAVPPSTGATQVMITSVPEIEVVGAAGVLGAVAGRTAPLPGLDEDEGPMALIAIT